MFLWLEKKIGTGGAAFALFLVLMIACWLAVSAWNWIGKVYWKHEAKTASAAAITAQGNADSANAGAANATATRQSMDDSTYTYRQESGERAGRIEHHADPMPDGDDRLPPDPDIVRELEAAERQARAAADRLQRTRAR